MIKLAIKSGRASASKRRPDDSGRGSYAYEPDLFQRVYHFYVTNAFTNITSTYPDGTYQFTIFDNTIEVSMPADSVLPNAPTLSNFAADQSINANADFTLQWNAFNTGGVLDFISVRLMS